MRLEDSPRLSVTSDMGKVNKCGFNIEGLCRRSNNPSTSIRKRMVKGSEKLQSIGKSLHIGASKAVFSEDLKVYKKKIFDPQDIFLIRMNRFFVISSLLSIAVDPLFFFLPVVDKNGICLGIDRKLAVMSTILRTLIDAFYLLRIYLQFHTAFIAPSSRVLGRGELVIDPSMIASRYLRRYFAIDVIAVLPLPQLTIWSFLLSSDGSDVLSTKTTTLFLVMFQYIPRFLRILPLTSEVKRTAGVFAETALAGAAYYLSCYLLAGHIVGALWYLLSIERQDTCWRSVCSAVEACKIEFLYCSTSYSKGYEEWKPISKNLLGTKCSADDDSPFNFGIYKQALTSEIVASDNFVAKFFYCLWFGLQNLSTLGQGFITSTYVGEAIFCIALAILGLILFALLIGNMQTYLQSLTVRLEEMRVKRNDMEQWMHHRLLPQELRERVRRYDQYKWLETRGVEEEKLVQNLPLDLRRDIKRHLCMALVRRVPLFENMDDRLLDAICEHLKPSLYIERTHIVREGDPVDQMLFIIRGRLESVTTDGGRTGFFNRGLLKEGDFCGEELLTWALDPKAGGSFPSSTRTVITITEVSAFALIADELKFVASQFKRLHSKQVQHTFRYYSQQWRTWATCFIQSAWRRHCKRKLAEQRRREEEAAAEQGEELVHTSSSQLSE